MLRLSAGVALLSDDVLVSVQTTIWLDVVAAAGARRPDACASSAGVRAHEVLGAAVALLNELGAGDWAGQTVKPGCVAPASLGALTMPDVSKWTIVTLAAPAASCAFEKRVDLRPAKPLQHHG